MNQTNTVGINYDAGNSLGLDYSSGNSISSLWPVLAIIIVCGLIIFIAYKKFFE